MISLVEARRRAAAVGYSMVETGERESDRWWFFPVRQIGSRGVVVDKTTGEVHVLGSAAPLEDQLWMHDLGVRDSNDFVIDAIDDRENTIEAVARLFTGDRWWARKSLILPATGRDDSK